ncbi:hypothetical protein ACHAXR_002064 [Thalassiosira sp. AJA248-18]
MPPIRHYQHRRPVRTLHEEHRPHPSVGRGFWYRYEFRQTAMEARDNGQHRDQLPVNLRHIRLWPSERSEFRWRRRRRMEGHFHPYCRTGNNRATVLRGLEAVQLAWLMAVYPRINAHEINVFLYHANGQIRFYHPSQIYRAQFRIGLSRKRSSTTAMQASLPINRQKRWSFWNMNYPFGIADIQTSDMIDIDEAAVFAESANRGAGKSHISTRCRDDGLYGHSQKTNVLLAISGDHATAQQDAERWLDMWEDGGTTIQKFVDFILRILHDIGPGTPQRRRCFTMDNLSSHRCQLVLQIIHQWGHRVAFRAPYHPVDGPIHSYLFYLQQL